VHRGCRKIKAKKFFQGVWNFFVPPGIIAGEGPSMLSDEQLMLNFQEGAEQAFEELFERYRRPVYHFFRRRLNNSSRAEDLTQETFAVVLRGTERYQPLAHFRTYLFAIAVKLLWTERRKEVREARAGAEMMGLPVETNPADALWIRDALAKLLPDHREVLMLREYEQLSYEEIAAVLAIPVNTVRSRLSRARAELKAFLERQTARGAPR
jgi:RNA polymerase sigma-70 factor, ECF subfamily